MKKTVTSEDIEAVLKNEDNLKIVKSVAGRFAKSLNKEELNSCIYKGVWKCLANYDEEKTKFTTWLYQNVYWECIRELKHLSKTLNTDKENPRYIEFIPDKVLSYIHRREYNDEVYEIRECLDKLPKKDSNILKEYYIYNMTLKELSEKYGYSIETMRKRVNKSVEKFTLIYGKHSISSV